MSISARLSVRSLIRLVAIVPVLASLTVVGSAARLGPAIAGCAEASTVHHATLVVEHSDGSGHGAGSVIRVCVPFSGDSITGDVLLHDSGVQHATGDSGQAVCQIDSEPATGTYQPQCLSAGKPYWAMFVSRGGGSWVYSSLGFSSQTFRDGDAEGFRYEGQSDGTTPPSPSGVCPVTTSSAPVPSRSTTPVPRNTSIAASAPISVSSAAVSVPTNSPTTTAPSSSPGPSTTASGRPAPSIVSTNRSVPFRGVSTGVWVAAALGGVLLLGLVLQLARARRRSPQRPPP